MSTSLLKYTNTSIIDFNTTPLRLGRLTPWWRETNMQKENIVTPKGTLVYPHLNRADQKFDKDGVWRASLRLPKKEAEPLMDTDYKRNRGQCSKRN